MPLSIPQPRVMLGLGSSPAAVTESSGITRPGEVHSAGDMLLLESKELGGEGTRISLRISYQEGLPVNVLRSIPHRRPIRSVPQPDSTLGSVFSRRVLLNLSQKGIVVRAAHWLQLQAEGCWFEESLTVQGPATLQAHV